MKLTFCFGKTTSDSINLALDKIKSLVLSGEKVYIVVPDRASLITEMESIKSFGISGALNFRILTINKLASMVLINEPNTLSSFGASLLVKKILKQQSQNLVCFNKIASNINFASEMYRLIEQLKSSQIKPNQLLFTGKMPNGIRLKMQDIKLIWEEYEKELEKNFSDGFSRLKQFKEKIKTSDEVKNGNFVFLYSSGYTKEILSCVCEIIKNANSSIIALPKADKNQNNSDIYLNNAEEFFVEFAKQNSFEIDTFTSIETNEIKQNLFAFMFGQDKKINDNLHLFEFKNETEEINSICNLILSRVSYGLNFDDFNIILTDAENYAKPLLRALKRNKIPHFFDNQINISSQALSKLVVSLVNCFYFDFQSRFVFDLIKNYYLGLNAFEMSTFENYVFKHAIEGGMFFSKFFDEEAESVRERLTPIIDCYKKFKKSKNANELIEIITNLLFELNIEEKTNELVSALENVEDFENAKISQQIKDKLFEVFNDISLIFNNEQIELKEFRDVLLNGIAMKTISIVPVKTNSVYVGDLQNSYFASNKINIVLGASFGNFPFNVKDVGLISDDEIKQIKLTKVLEPTIKELNQRAMFKCFDVCCDGHELVVSFSKEVAGENKAESLASASLRSIYANQLEKFEKNVNICSFSDFVLSQKTPQVQSEVGRVSITPNNDEVAVTSIEKFFDCPLKFTLLNQVKLKERETGVAKAFDIGNIYHEFMHDLTLQIDQISEKNLKEKCEKIINNVLSNKKYETLLEVDKNKLIIKNIKKESVKLAKVAMVHHSSSAFKANKNLLEVSFGEDGRLDPPFFKNAGKNYNLRGKIDRVDTFGNMARVIDYKTGSDKFSFSDVFYGKKIQLISYLSCIEENGYNGVGAYYFPLKNGYKGKSFVPKLDGITLKDLSVVKKLDLKLTAGEKSKLINVALKKDGSFSENTGKNFLLSAKEMKDIQFYVKKLSAGAIDDISSGFAEAWPSQKSANVCSCDFCPFKNSFYCLNAKKRKMQQITKQNFEQKEGD